MVFADRSRGWWWGFVGRTRYDYQIDVGDGTSNAIVMTCIDWVCRVFPEAPIVVASINADGEDVPQPRHPMKLLLDMPNEYYPGELLWSATLADRGLSGNAYWVKRRSAQDRVVELYWVPSDTMEPRWEGNDFITYYEYRPDSTVEPIRIPVRDVVHFRYPRFDKRNNRKGASPLAPLLREIFTDDEAANWTASTLRNAGVPPVVLSPANADLTPTREELEETKSRYQDVTTGDNRGKVLVMTGATKVDRLGFSPTEMDLRELRRIPEERIPAAFGLNAMVLSLGAGLDRSTYSNYEQAFRSAYRGNIVPTQRLMASELETQLLADFGAIERLKLEFDTSKVQELQEDEDAKHARFREDLNAGGISLNEFRDAIGLDPLDGEDGDVFYIPSTVTPTNPDELIPEALPQPTMIQEVPQQALPPAGTDGKVLPLRKAPPHLGQPLLLTEEELAALAEITAMDIERARRLWREEAPEPFAELLEAGEAP